MEFERSAYVDQLMERRENGQVKILTGIRQCGKSYLLLRLFRRRLLSEGVSAGHILTVALNDRANKSLRDPDALLSHLKAQMTGPEVYYILLDDIQRVGDFVEVLSSLQLIPNADVYVTGGSAQGLSSDVVTEFRGHGDEIRLHPLSFRELLNANPGDQDQLWDDYLTYGGLPAVLTRQSADDKAEHLRSLLSQLYLADLAQRYQLRNREELDDLIGILAGLVGSFTNPTKLAKTFKNDKGRSITDKTLRRYLGHLEDAFFVGKAERYDIKGSRYLNTPAKYYFEDLGLLSARQGFWQQDESRTLENLIYNELRVRGFHVDVGVLEQNERTTAGGKARRYLEVDFVACRGDRKYYLQSAFSPDPDAAERRPLRAIDDSFKKIVLVRENRAPHRDAYGILTMGVRRFALEPDSLEL